MENHGKIMELCFWISVGTLIDTNSIVDRIAMAAFITPASAQFALEHQKIWLSVHHLTESPGHRHGHGQTYRRKSRSDHDLRQIEDGRQHHLGESPRHLCWSKGNLQHRSHSDYFCGEKHHRHNADSHHMRSPGMKRHQIGCHDNKGEVHQGSYSSIDKPGRHLQTSSTDKPGRHLPTSGHVKGNGSHGELQTGRQSHRNHYVHHFINHKVWKYIYLQCDIIIIYQCEIYFPSLMPVPVICNHCSLSLHPPPPPPYTHTHMQYRDWPSVCRAMTLSYPTVPSKCSA